MGGERFVVLGLARVRAPWFQELSRWATSSMLPVEFVKAMSIEEVRTRLDTGRRYSALVVDDSVPGFDRDLIDRARSAGCSVIAVDSGRTPHRWSDLGVSGVLPASFERAELLQLLTQVASPVGELQAVADVPAAPPADPFRGDLVVVTGGGGTGRSTVAMALAQGLATDPRYGGLTCLADLALHADQAMLHGAADVVPGLLELVEAHRGGTPTAATTRGLTWQVEPRGYHLLLGLRRHRDWTSLRPRVAEVALDGLRRCFRVVVADVDGDLEGEQATGSVDVEERNALTRIAVSSSDLVVAVGSPGMKGIHTLLRVVRDLLQHGVPGARILPVCNNAPRGPRARAELTHAFGSLLAHSVGGATGVPSPVFLPQRRNVDLLQRDVARLPGSWVAGVSGPVLALLEAAGPDPAVPPLLHEPVVVAPGSLGRWADDDAQEA